MRSLSRSASPAMITTVRRYRQPAPLPDLGFWQGACSLGSIFGPSQVYRAGRLRRETFVDDYERLSMDFDAAQRKAAQDAAIGPRIAQQGCRVVR